MLRMGKLAREVAGGLLAGIGDLLGISDLGRAIAEFDRLSETDVANARSWVAADPVYQYAVSALGTDNGQRTF